MARTTTALVWAMYLALLITVGAVIGVLAHHI